MGRYRKHTAKLIMGLLISAVALAVLVGGIIPLSNPNVLSFLNASSALAQDEGEKPDKGQEEFEQAPCPECPECPNPADVVLRGLEEKKKRLVMEEERLKQEKKALEQFSEELDERLTGLEALKQQIDADLVLIDKKKTEQELQEEARFEATMNRLVKVYSGMKPKNAAVIINKMDLEVARQIFSRMRETASAQILGYVDVDKAAKISESIVYTK